MRIGSCFCSSDIYYIVLSYICIDIGGPTVSECCGIVAVCYLSVLQCMHGIAWDMPALLFDLCCLLELLVFILTEYNGIHIDNFCQESSRNYLLVSVSCHIILPHVIDVKHMLGFQGCCLD